MTVGHYRCVIDIEIDDCDMGSFRSALMLAVMAIFGWAQTRRQSDNGAKYLTEICY